MKRALLSTLAAAALAVVAAACSPAPPEQTGERAGSAGDWPSPTIYCFVPRPRSARTPLLRRTVC